MPPINGINPSYASFDKPFIHLAVGLLCVFSWKSCEDIGKLFRSNPQFSQAESVVKFLSLITPGSGQMPVELMKGLNDSGIKSLKEDAHICQPQMGKLMNQTNSLSLKEKLCVCVCMLKLQLIKKYKCMLMHEFLRSSNNIILKSSSFINDTKHYL